MISCARTQQDPSSSPIVDQGAMGISRRRFLGGGASAVALVAASCRVGGRPAATTSTGGSAGQAPTTVEVLAGFTAEQRAALQTTVVDPFERAHADLLLTFDEAPAADLDRKLLALVAAGTPPDVAATAPPYLYLAKLTQDVADRVRRDRYDTGVFAKEGFESAAAWQGRIVGLPYYVGGNSSVLAYNQDLFRASGAPEPPTRSGAPEWNADSWLQVLQP